jgi:hypothetical protein
MANSNSQRLAPPQVSVRRKLPKNKRESSSGDRVDYNDTIEHSYEIKF